MLTILALTVVSLLLFQPVATPPPADDLQAAQNWLSRVQHLSFATDREYCGYLGYNESGEIVFTDMVRGGHDGCTPELPETGLTLIASLHSHGAYDPDVPAEFPTSLDMESDREEGVNGYVSTPGGRLWYIDSSAMIAVQICGLRCLPQDPSFHSGDDGFIQESYSHSDLVRLESQ